MFWKIALAMLAFAANSVLCRLALVGQHIDPMSFTTLRVSSGAVVLMLLFLSRPHRHKIEWNWLHAVFLAVYMLAFSIAYLKIDAGVGALLLFGTVQLSMVLYAVWRGERVSLPRGIGLVLAFAGIVFLLLPGAQAPDLKYSLVMILSGLAWGAYSIVGQRNRDPLSSSLANFLLAVPLVLISTVLLNMDRYFDVQGIVLAILSGGLASSGAYVLWYAIVKKIDRVTASTVQLSVPCLAILGGTWLIGESVNLRTIMATVMVLLGIWLVIIALAKPARV